MVFPTLSFLVFYLVTWPLSWAAVRADRHTLHKLVLVAASLVFYSSWNTRLAAVLVASVLFNWAMGHLIHRALHRSGHRSGRLHRWEGRSVARALVFAAVAVNLGTLGYFKYCNFFLEG